MIKLPEWIKKTEATSKISVSIYNENSAFDEVKFYFKAIWNRVANWKNYPRDYINICESQGIFILYHFKNGLLVHTQNISVSDYEWREYASQYSGLPVYFIVQGHDCEFRSLPTNQIRIWDRFFLFNQIKTNEFCAEDLVNHYQPKQPTEKVDVFVSIRSNDQLKQMFKALSSMRNPVGGVLSWDIEQSLAMKKHVSISRSLRAWTAMLVPVDSNTSTILIMHQDKFLLQRVISTKNTGDLEKELRSTLRFLQRQGYKEGQAVSVLSLENGAVVTEFSNAELELIPVSKRLLEKEAYRPIKPFLNFVPKSLSQAHLAHVLPRLAIKFLIPISMILVILWATVQIKSFFQDYEHKWLGIKYEKIHKRTVGKFAEQVHLSNLFMNYIDSSKRNPSVFISNVNKMLRGKTQALDITWNQTERGTELRLRLPNAAKKNQDLKRYINQNYERILGDVVLSWDENGNDTILLIQQQVGQHGN